MYNKLPANKMNKKPQTKHRDKERNNTDKDIVDRSDRQIYKIIYIYHLINKTQITYPQRLCTTNFLQTRWTKKHRQNTETWFGDLWHDKNQHSGNTLLLPYLHRQNKETNPQTLTPLNRRESIQNTGH